MVIVQRRVTWFPVKKSSSRTRSFFIISGALCVAWLDDVAEQVVGAVVLKAGGHFISVRVPPGIYHVDFPLSTTTAHLESASAVSEAQRDVIFPPEQCEQRLKQLVRSMAIAFLRRQNSIPSGQAT